MKRKEKKKKQAPKSNSRIYYYSQPTPLTRLTQNQKQKILPVMLGQDPFPCYIFSSFNQPIGQLAAIS